MSERLREVMQAYPKFRELNRELGSHPQREMALALRSRVGSLFRKIRRTSGGAIPSSKVAIQYLGCSLDEFRTHIENQFKDGMTWLNHGKWHIDHIRPCASFFLEDVAQMRLCFHYTNLQPLWGPENCSKGDEWDGEWSVPDFAEPPVFFQKREKKVKRTSFLTEHDLSTMVTRRPRNPPRSLPSRPLSKRFLRELAEARRMSSQCS